MDVWIDHVALNCAGNSKYPLESIFARIGSSMSFTPLADAHSELRNLLSYYCKGMTEPLRFFPETSAKYAERITKNQSHEVALQAARSDWEGSDFGRSEKDDPYYRICFGNIDPLDDAFALIAKDIFTPMINGRSKKPRKKR